MKLWRLVVWPEFPQLWKFSKFDSKYFELKTQKKAFYYLDLHFLILPLLPNLINAQSGFFPHKQAQYLISMHSVDFFFQKQ